MIGPMALLSRQKGPIAVYGATGYTGKLVAAELAAADADFVLAGRNREKLEQVASDLDGDPPVSDIALDDAEGLRSLFGDCAAVINCAGPFVKHGEPVLRAAVETETHYLDTTGEQPYIRMAFERYGVPAEQAGVAVIPAMGFDFVPGDMIAALTAQGMGEVDEVTLAYAWEDFEPSRGTMQTTLEVLSGEAVEWRKLQWLPAEHPFGRERFEFDEPIGRQRMLRYPSGEQITIPRHIATRRVTTLLTASTFAPHPRLGALMTLIARPTGLALKTPLKRALRAAVSRLPEGPDPEKRAATRYTIVAEVARGKQRRRGVLHGRDTYGVTAALVTQGAFAAARGEISSSGALAPSQAFDPSSFLDGLDRFGIEWEVAAPREAVPAEA
jgi:short subunit dehydrogenase-like uncharacterized protein